MEALEAYTRLELGANSPDVATLFLPMDRKNPTIEEPADLEEGASEVKKLIFQETVKECDACATLNTTRRRCTR